MQKCLLETSGNLYGYSCSLLWKHGRPSKKEPVCQPHSVRTVLDRVRKKLYTREWLVFNNLFVFLDINECMLHPNICGTAICKNTLGKYECECAEGYIYNSTSKNCEGRSFPPVPPFLFLLSCLFFFFSTTVPNSSISSSGVFINLHIVYYNVTQLFGLSEVQWGYITCSVYSCNDLLPDVGGF